MDVIQTTGRKRETYEVRIESSLLWECALGIAAITNKRLLKTLDQPDNYWERIRQSLSDEMIEQLNFVEKNNTWKALLQLLHQKSFSDLNTFQTYIDSLTVEELRFICIPYVGSKFQEIRSQASNGDPTAIHELQSLTKDNIFFPTYIEFICTYDVQALKEHLVTVMEGWYQTVIEPTADNLSSILKTDTVSKQNMKMKMKSEELVEWATGGISYPPEPNVQNVLLIPQYIYRPWNIEADIEGTKVFYYPVANESIHPGDAYTPGYFLVQKHKALGDEVRLRIVKLLSEHARTLQELTEQLELGKSTIHHHLKILRSARIVEVRDSKYTLKKSSITALAKELEHFLYRENQVVFDG
ncbi:ArsR family transcriptional regulator [Alkalihalobacillus sp. AL-G]|uniref:ArsR family transcriptional regulator n=1 Tax=Alkalihalobacillus sp. AL-G TaxID=2926399 RepID=UPI00272A7416|nr:ArsR family transcriptional regulator [Alkalihalobacillus sp. AL-G]WLD94288.1 ArsR family transcriptional regulator [Alkalihalobacillus sp. AL-G]